ncbi:MAG: hypothetical protein MZV70_56660 [Desulfobacterales bacterium]|nr:hypothetical protein [Desulfobacterales bacterium]
MIWASRRIRVESGKGRKDRIVYISNDARRLSSPVSAHPLCSSNPGSMFVVEKGPAAASRCRCAASRSAWSIMPARPSCGPAAISCATRWLPRCSTRMLPLVSIQDLLGHNWIMTTQRYCKVSNVKVQRDYHQAMERIVSRYRGARNVLTEAKEEI